MEVLHSHPFDRRPQRESDPSHSVDSGAVSPDAHGGITNAANSKSYSLKLSNRRTLETSSGSFDPGFSVERKDFSLHPIVDQLLAGVIFFLKQLQTGRLITCTIPRRLGLCGLKHM